MAYGYKYKRTQKRTQEAPVLHLFKRKTRKSYMRATLHVARALNTAFEAKRRDSCARRHIVKGSLHPPLPEDPTRACLILGSRPSHIRPEAD